MFQQMEDGWETRAILSDKDRIHQRAGEENIRGSTMTETLSSHLSSTLVGPPCYGRALEVNYRIITLPKPAHFVSSAHTSV